MPTLARLAVLDDTLDVVSSLADWDRLRSRGVSVDFLHHHLGHDGPAIAAALHGYDAVALMRERTPLSAQTLASLTELRLLLTTGMANPSVDIAAARAAGIEVCGTAGSLGPTPELTWALLLAALRGVPQQGAAMREGVWQSMLGRGAEGLRIGIAGLGKVGSRVAGYAKAFGMEVHAWSPRLDDERAAAAGAVRAPSLRELAGRVDVLSVHLRLAESSRGIVSEEVLRALGPRGLLVNTARSGLVDTPALLRGLNEGWLGGAALDVFDVEPVPAGDPILAAPRTVLTPHLGYVTRQSYEAFYEQIIEDVEAYLDGAPIRRLG